MWRIALIFLIFGLMQAPLSGTATIDGKTSYNLIPYVDRVETIVINEGEGGLVAGMAITLSRLMFSKTKVIINGYCFSACTLLLSSPNTYFTKNARFYFHSSYDSFCRDGIRIYDMSPKTNEFMLSMFNIHTAEWIKETKAFSSVNLVMIPNDVIMLDYSNKLIETDIEPLDRSYGPMYILGKSC